MEPLYIKNMVCKRCIHVVRQEIEGLGLQARHIELGEVYWDSIPSASQLQALEKALIQHGFAYIDDKKSRIIERIKNSIIEFVRQQAETLEGNSTSPEWGNRNLSDYLMEAVGPENCSDYPYLSNLFSSVEGTTIEKYLIAQRIEKVKELLVYGEHSLSEIANALQYSSVSYLSTQFKKVTGLTPSHFRQIGQQKRKALDELRP